MKIEIINNINIMDEFIEYLLNPTESTKISNGEVLTPIYIIKEILPVWKNKNIGKFI